MSLSFIQKNPSGASPCTPDQAFGSSALTSVASFGSSTTANNRLVACATFWISSGSPTATFSDSKANSWATDKSQARSQSTVSIGSAKLTSAGSSHTVTVTPSLTCDICLGAYEVGSTVGNHEIHSTNSGNDSTSAVSAGSLSLSAAEGIAFGGMAYQGSTTTIALNWTGATYAHEEESIDYPACGMAYEVVTVAETPAWTLGTAMEWAACGVMYVETAAGAAVGGGIYDDRYRFRPSQGVS